MNDRKHNGQKKNDKRVNNDLQNIHIKLKIEEHEQASPTLTTGEYTGCITRS